MTSELVLLDIVSATRLHNQVLDRKPNSRTYNFVEVSGRNLESSQIDVSVWIS